MNCNIARTVKYISFFMKKVLIVPGYGLCKKTEICIINNK
jgi:hypothetical protein